MENYYDVYKTRQIWLLHASPIKNKYVLDPLSSPEEIIM